MRIIRAILFGAVGVLVSLALYDIILTLTGYEYGLIVSFMGMLTAAHVAYGYLGKDRVDEENFGTLVWVAVLFSFIASVAPYFVLTSFGDGSELIFIGIGAYGGYEFVRYLWDGQHEQADRFDAAALPTRQEVTLGRRLKIYFRKSRAIISWYLVTAIGIILLGAFFFDGLGVSWILVVIFIIYDLWRKKVFVITDEDLNE